MPKKKLDTSEEFDSSPKKAKKSKKKQKNDESATEILEDSIESANTSINNKGNPKAKKKKSMQPQPTEQDDEEEEKWLEAIEAGKNIEDVDDELKKIKDPKLMTARQRAMYEKNINDSSSVSPTFKATRKSLPSTTTIVDGMQANVSSSGELLLALPNFKVKKDKEKLPLTAEDIEKSKEKAQKRKQLADEKREKDKKKTMERLLKKQDSKLVKSIKVRPVKSLVPVISYRNNASGAFLHLPQNFEFPLKPQKPIDPPKKQMCGIQGCKNLKKYSCSKTNIPLCSLECFKKNVDSIKQTFF